MLKERVMPTYKLKDFEDDYGLRQKIEDIFELSLKTYIGWHSNDWKDFPVKWKEILSIENENDWKNYWYLTPLLIDRFMDVYYEKMICIKPVRDGDWLTSTWNKFNRLYLFPNFLENMPWFINNLLIRIKYEPSGLTIAQQGRNSLSANKMYSGNYKQDKDWKKEHFLNINNEDRTYLSEHYGTDLAAMNKLARVNFTPIIDEFIAKFAHLFQMYYELDDDSSYWYSNMYQTEWGD